MMGGIDEMMCSGFIEGWLGQQSFRNCLLKPAQQSGKKDTGKCIENHV
jgi:hypothetical protein